MTTVMLCKNIIGSGIFTLPVALKLGSLVPGLVALFSVALLAAVAFYMVGYGTEVLQCSNFRDAWIQSCGGKDSRLGPVIDYVMVVNGVFTLVNYCIMMGDVFSKALVGLFGADSVLALGRGSVLAILALVLLPLSLSPDLRGLRYSSALGLAGMAYSVGLVITDTFRSEEAVAGRGVAVASFGQGFFECVAIFSYAYVAHYNAPRLYIEMRRRSLTRWGLVVGGAYCISFLLYGFFALAGLYRFGGDVQGNLLKMYEPTTFVMVAWFTIGVSTAMSFPIVFHPFLDSCVGVALQASPHMGRQGEKEQSTFNVRCIVTFVLVPTFAAIGAKVDDLGLVTALCGALTSCIIAYIVPAVIFHGAIRELQRQSGSDVPPRLQAQYSFLKSTCVVLGVVGCGLLAISTYDTLAGSMK